MATNPTSTPLNLAQLLESWQVVLRAEDKAKTTLRNYNVGVLNYISWCEDREVPTVIDRQQVTEWVAHLLDSGLQPTPAKAHQLAVRRFSAWLDGEDDIAYTDPLIGIK